MIVTLPSLRSFRICIAASCNDCDMRIVKRFISSSRRAMVMCEIKFDQAANWCWYSLALWVMLYLRGLRVRHNRGHRDADLVVIGAAWLIRCSKPVERHTKVTFVSHQIPAERR